VKGTVALHGHDSIGDHEVRPDRGADVEYGLVIPLQWRRFLGHP
jgi:hypothetical protein